MKRIKVEPRKLDEIFELSKTMAFTEFIENICIKDKKGNAKEIKYNIKKVCNVRDQIDYLISNAVKEFSAENSKYKINTDKIYCYFHEKTIDFLDFDLILEIDGIELLSIEDLLDKGFSLKKIQKIMKEK